MQTRTKVWFITGVSRGLGQELAKAVLSRGDAVIGTSRNGSADLPPSDGRLHVLPLDLTIADQAKTVVQQAHQLYGRLDVVVNNAGFGLLGAIEESNETETRHVFEVNFFGALRIIQAALPLLRAQKHGHIVNVSSIAGLAPMAGSGLYAAAKFALGGMSESLSQELAPLNIRVTVVEPGAFRTDFLSEQSIQFTTQKIDDYAETSGKAIGYLEAIAGKQLGDPALGAKAIIDAVESENPPLHLLLGSDALARARAKVQRFSDELNHWESVSRSTDFA